jgi:hypothetical protein
MRKRFLVLVCMGIAIPLHAGTNGILEGTVKDRRTGELFPGVNVVIIGLQRGATTDQRGSSSSRMCGPASTTSA